MASTRGQRCRCVSNAHSLMRHTPSNQPTHDYRCINTIEASAIGSAAVAAVAAAVAAVVTAAAAAVAAAPS